MAERPTAARVTRLLPPEEWRKRQIKNLKAVGESSYVQGLGMPKKDPIEAGIKADAYWQARLKAAMDGGLRVLGLSATNIAEWFKYAMDPGAGTLVDGVVKREAKISKFLGSWVPLLTTHVGELDKTAVTTDKEAEDKMVANLKGLRALHGAVKGAKPAA